MLLFGQAIVSPVLALARRCQACGRRQVVPSSRKRQSVACRNCGSRIPPANHQMFVRGRPCTGHLGPGR